ncbi:rhodanese-like domain-containing protein [Hyphococcus sp.]|uniref:rhodanese-like domain-containing protein n=1 Tax=Hyphococcus sp. TaxID=2038636 RepID=UPI003CCB78DD
MKRFAYLSAMLCLWPGAALSQDSFGGSQSSRPQQQQEQQQQQQQQSQSREQMDRQSVPQQQPQQRPSNADPQSAAELQDFGVPATSQLHAGAMHGPTPSSIPGGQIITTKGLVELIQGRQTPFLLLDILGGPEILPGAVFAVPAHQAGNFNDQTQREFGGFLQQMTGGDKETPLVLYCQSTQCWMSYNAALRAINMGYTNVLWYRGGIEAWKAAGQQTTYPQQ